MTSFDIITTRIAKLTPDIIDEIRVNAGLKNDVVGTVFRPSADVGLLIFKDRNDNKSKSIYTINIDTLRPTLNSLNKTPLPNIAIIALS